MLRVRASGRSPDDDAGDRRRDGVVLSDQRRQVGRLRDVLGDDAVVDRHRLHEVVGPAVELGIDIGDESTLRGGTGYDLAVDQAVDRPVRVTGDDNVDLIAHRVDDRWEGARRIDAGVDERRVGAGAVAGRSTPPSWSRTTIALTPRVSSSGTSALTVSASSRKFTAAMPSGLTIQGVPSSVMPMKATFTPSKRSMA